MVPVDSAVTLAWWQFLVLAGLAVYGIFHLLVLPALHRYFYYRSQAAEQLLDRELGFGLPTYAIASRPIWLDRIINDAGVREVMEESRTRTGESLQAIRQRTRAYAQEIVPSFNVLIYFRFGYWLARIFLRIYYWITVGRSADSDYDRISDDTLVVLVSNHRSNFDPLLLVYLASKRSPISYSAGAWALNFPFKQILHTIGFYILRADAMGDRFYRRVLERYVFLAGSQCVPQGLFIEGVLSRDGRMQPLKLGMLNYLLKAYGHGNCKDIMFIPAALNYDKIPEDRTLVAHRVEGFANKGRFYSLLSFLRFILTVVTYAMPRRHKPFGYACVNFGVPLSLSAWQQARGEDIATQSGEQRRNSIEALGKDLAQTIEGLIPVLPANVLAHVLSASNDLPISEIKLKVRALNLLTKLSRSGAPVLLPNNDEDYAFGQAIYVLIRRKVIRPTGDGRYELASGHADLLEYYCNTIAHYLP